MEIEELAELLQETEAQHAAFESVAPKHNWYDWYAAYLVARQRGSNPEEAALAARTFMADAKGIVIAGAP